MIHTTDNNKQKHLIHSSNSIQFFACMHDENTNIRHSQKIMSEPFLSLWFYCFCLCVWAHLLVVEILPGAVYVPFNWTRVISTHIRPWCYAYHIHADREFHIFSRSEVDGRVSLNVEPHNIINVDFMIQFSTIPHGRTAFFRKSSTSFLGTAKHGPEHAAV